MTSICVLTFDAPHLKTEQVLNGLALQGRHDLAVMALPFKYRPPREPLFQHRPQQDAAAHPRELAAYFGYAYRQIQSDKDLPGGFEYYLVAGAALFSSEAVTGRRIVNCHPGIIPTVRGLDAFKWAILDGQILGLSLHLIDAAVDSGELISVVRTPVMTNDTLATLARRHYEIEVEMTINFERYFQRPRFDVVNVPSRPARMRMPLGQEEQMLAAAPAYIHKYSKG